MSKQHVSSEISYEESNSDNQSCRSDWTNTPAKHYVVQIGQYGGLHPAQFDKYAKSTVKKRNIPYDNFFGEMANNHNNTIFNSPEADSLASLDVFSRLDVVVHGNRNSPFEAREFYQTNEQGRSVKAREETQFTAKVMAEKLAAMGLKNVGVLRLDSCNVGAGAYLQQLRAALRDLDIRVGYLAAPNGYLQDVHIPFTATRPVYSWRFWEDRWTVIKGNLDVEFPGTRYNGSGR
ncbi:hypothetical protein V1599_20760 [Enterobacter sp. ECC-175]|uniref:hypothetical protein n=1 Tax=unclassified Enterobacter TaxID=2608935 RepID=UPI0011BE2216|nr:hypothetical protein [Enterobacter sp. RIT 418]